MTDYRKWDKYDVSAAEVAVEETAAAAARASKLDKLDREQWDLEKSAVGESLRDVESYESRAAVEELAGRPAPLPPGAFDDPAPPDDLFDEDE